MSGADGLVPADSSREAEWIAERIEKPWSREPGVNCVASVIPSGFQGYARILHPATGPDGREVGWAEVARRHGRVPHAEMQWEAIIRAGRQAEGRGGRRCSVPGHQGPGQPGLRRASRDVEPPSTGTFPIVQARSLADILQRFTATASEVYFAVWDGWGLASPLYSGQTVSLLKLPDRSYYLMKGPLWSAFEAGGLWPFPGASLWWPKDRAWFVATEVDFMWTYVGGTLRCIEAILADPRLETWKASLDDRADCGGDRINV